MTINLITYGALPQLLPPALREFLQDSEKFVLSEISLSRVGFGHLSAENIFCSQRSLSAEGWVTLVPSTFRRVVAARSRVDRL